MSENKNRDDKTTPEKELFFAETSDDMSAVNAVERYTISNHNS